LIDSIRFNVWLVSGCAQVFVLYFPLLLSYCLLEQPIQHRPIYMVAQKSKPLTNYQNVVLSYYIVLKPDNEIRFIPRIKISIKH